MAHRIYYIEDDAGIAEGVAFFLRRKGFEVITAAMVAEGKQLLGKGLPSVVLVDWNLPDGSGEGLCRWIREKWPMLPVIFLTDVYKRQVIIQREFFRQERKAGGKRPASAADRKQESIQYRNQSGQTYADEKQI